MVCCCDGGLLNPKDWSFKGWQGIYATLRLRADVIYGCLLCPMLQAACGGPNAPLAFEGTPWNSSTVALIAAAKAHTEMVLLQVRG